MSGTYRPKTAADRRVCVGSSGFTLLELVIAMTILTLVTMIIGGGLRLGINAWKKGELETDETQRLRILSGMFSRQIKSAYPYKMIIDDKDVIVFRGEKNALLFVTTTMESSFDGLKWVRYEYRDNMLLYKEGLLPDKKLTEHISGDEETLDRDIGDVVFEYYSKDEENWKEEWEPAETLPEAVRVKISYFQPFQINIMTGTDVKKEGKAFDKV